MCSMVVDACALGSCSPPYREGPYNNARGKCSFNPSALHFAAAITRSILSKSCFVHVEAINGYNTPGDITVVIAVHFVFCDNLQCFNLPRIIAALFMHIVVCVELSPFGAMCTPSVLRAEFGSSRGIVVMDLSSIFHQGL